MTIQEISIRTIVKKRLKYGEFPSTGICEVRIGSIFVTFENDSRTKIADRKSYTGDNIIVPFYKSFFGIGIIIIIIIISHKRYFGMKWKTTPRSCLYCSQYYSIMCLFECVDYYYVFVCIIYYEHERFNRSLYLKFFLTVFWQYSNLFFATMNTKLYVICEQPSMNISDVYA